MGISRLFRSRVWGPALIGVAAAAIAITNPSRDGIQTAAGCSGAGSESDEWETIQASGATETWSLDGFHYWIGLPGGWSEGMPRTLEDVPNTQLEVTDAAGNPIPGQLALHKIRRQSVALTWRADTELAEGSTLHSRLILGPEEWQTREQTLIVADAGKGLEVPDIQSTAWVTEILTDGPAVSCESYDTCGVSLGSEEVATLTWHLGWTEPPAAPWSWELLMTKGRTLERLGPQWVGHRSWRYGSISLHLEPADEYCFKIVGTDFSSGTSITSEETCSAPGIPEEEVFLELGELLDCYLPPDHPGLRARWCEHNVGHAACPDSDAGSGGSSGTGGSTGDNSGGSGGTGAASTVGGSAGTGGTSETGCNGGNADSGGSGGSLAAGGSGATSAEEPKSRVSTGSCWCSVPRPAARGHAASALGGLLLLGFWRRRRPARSV